MSKKFLGLGGLFAFLVSAIVALSVQGATAQTLTAPQPGFTAIIAQPAGGSTLGKLLSAATDNSTLIAAGAHNLYSVHILSTNATAAYLKLYNKATAPTCGTDTPVATIPIIQNVPQDFVLPAGAQFSLGLGLCITANAADNDTASATTGITVSYSYK
jgi:hypothetical protein